MPRPRAGADGRRGFGLFIDSSGDHSCERFDLTFLNIDEEKARQALIAREIELAQKISLDRLNGQHDEGSQANGKQNYPGLVAGTMQRIDRL